MLDVIHLIGSSGNEKLHDGGRLKATIHIVTYLDKHYVYIYIYITMGNVQYICVNACKHS